MNCDEWTLPNEAIEIAKKIRKNFEGNFHEQIIKEYSTGNVESINFWIIKRNDITYTVVHPNQNYKYLISMYYSRGLLYSRWIISNMFLPSPIRESFMPKTIEMPLRDSVKTINKFLDTMKLVEIIET